MQSGIRTVVIGAWPVTPARALGEYTVERLLELAGQRSSYTIRRDVLTREALDFYSHASPG